MNSAKTLVGLTRSQLEKELSVLGLPPFRARQLFGWMYKKFVTEPELMTDLSAKLRGQLAEAYEWPTLKLKLETESADGTKKYLFVCPDQSTIETVWIPQRGRYTVCVSSQVGCRMGCTFCTTGTMGLKRSLEVWEIVSQVIEMKRRHLVTNIVFMGMGEPFDNYDNVLQAVTLLIDNLAFGLSRRRVTVSTSGIVPRIVDYARQSPAQLAVSLNSTTNELRYQLMPVNKRYPIEDIVEAIRVAYTDDRRRVTFEYILMKDLNDSREDALRLAKLLKGLPSKINLILFNPNGELPYDRPEVSTVEQFQKTLLQAGLNATIRWSRGLDIEAACGQLISKTERGTYETSDWRDRGKRSLPAPGP